MDESSNPALSRKTMERLAGLEGSSAMTVRGSLVKAGYALLIVFLSAGLGWNMFATTAVSGWWLFGVSMAAFIVGMVAAFKANAFTVTLYAVLEGLLLGVVSRFMETAYDGIVVQAILVTMATTVAMFALYATGVVTVTKKLRSVIMIATLGLVLYLFLEMIISMFSPSFLTMVSSGGMGIAIALVIVFIAALNLLLDFNFISEGASKKLPKKAEWFAAFGLTVTLIWLYVSVLRLLAASRR